MLNNLNNTLARSETVSFSRLNTYTECPSKYDHQYVKKTPGHKPIKDYFILGNLVHSCIEEFLRGTDKDLAFVIQLRDWLETKCFLVINDAQAPLDITMLEEYAIQYGTLAYRCSPIYGGEDAIRTQKGDICKDPINYPPQILKTLYNDLNLYKKKNAIDNVACMQNSVFRNFSLADTVAKAYYMFQNFYVPDWVEETVATEFELSEGRIEWDTDKYWNGAIDWVVKTKDGAIVIIDHKTSKSKPDPLEVAWHPQLNLYAYLYEEITGKAVDYIGINHLGSANLILAKVDTNINISNLKHWRSIQESINKDIQTSFRKLLPTDYNSKCVERDYSSKQVTGVCPYLEHCHPIYMECVKHEVANFLGN